MIKIALCAVVALCIGVVAYGKLTEPKTYEECVVKYVHNANTNKAAGVMAGICAEKFPKINKDFDDIFGVKSD